PSNSFGSMPIFVNYDRGSTAGLEESSHRKMGQRQSEFLDFT
ncbi:hypothetical protein GCK32_010274, partial [Trichostrongylus colubriformis]